MKIYIVSDPRTDRYEWEIRVEGKTYGISLNYFDTTEETEKEAKYVMAKLGVSDIKFEYVGKQEEM